MKSSADGNNWVNEKGEVQENNPKAIEFVKTFLKNYISNPLYDEESGETLNPEYSNLEIFGKLENNKQYKQTFKALTSPNAIKCYQANMPGTIDNILQNARAVNYKLQKDKSGAEQIKNITDSFIHYKPTVQNRKSTKPPTVAVLASKPSTSTSTTVVYNGKVFERPTRPAPPPPTAATKTTKPRKLPIPPGWDKSEWLTEALPSRSR
jgi:hypothetical protein